MTLRARNHRTGKVGRRFRGAAFAAAFAAAAMAPNYALAKQPKPQPTKEKTKVSLSLKQAVGAYYRKGNGMYGFVMFGMAATFSRKFGSLDAKLRLDLDASFKGLELADGQLDTISAGVTIPVNKWFAFGPMVYRSLYTGDVPIGGGVVFHVPELNLHAAPHVFKLNDSVAAPLPIFWTPTIGGRLGLRFKTILITNHPLLDKPAPLLGFEGGMTFKVLERWSLYGQAFTMLVRKQDGKMFVGPASVQAGSEITF